MKKDDAIAKIKKCLALSASSNEHEAETALRHAQALMEKYGIDDADMLAAGVSESNANSSAGRHPSNWESMLAAKVADTFGCNIVFKSSSFFKNTGTWSFIGCGASPEIATYAYKVLYRQLKRQRAEHIKNQLNRCKVTTKTRCADLFCEGWVRAIAGKLQAMNTSDEYADQLDAYMGKNYPTLATLKTKNRNAKANLSDRDYQDYTAGLNSGSNAELNRGVNQNQHSGLIE